MKRENKNNAKFEGEVIMVLSKLKKNIVPYVCIVIAALALLYSILPYLNATRFVVPVADDLQLGPGAGESYFAYAFRSMKSFYFGWQGSYVSLFLYALFSPFTRFGFTGIRFACFFSILFFYISLWICVCNITEYMLKIMKKWEIVTIYAMISMLVSNVHPPTEVFFWYTGICVYTIPFGFSLTGIGLLVHYVFESKKRYLIGAMVCAFIAGGGVLQCSAVICYFYLAITVWTMLEKNPQRVKVLAAFMVGLISTLINVCAPGNYVRHDVIDDSQLHLFISMRFSFSVVGWEMIRLLRETDFLFFILFFITVGVVIYRGNIQVKIELQHLCIAFVGLLGAMWISTYPVILGYSQASMASRSYFILDTLAVISAFVGSIMLGGFLTRYIDKMPEKYLFFVMGIILGVFLGIYVLGDKEIYRPVTRCIHDTSTGFNEKFRDTWEYVYQQIQESEEDDVIVEITDTPESDILMDPHISSDPSYWVNGMVKMYYGKDSVCIKLVDQ